MLQFSIERSKRIYAGVFIKLIYSPFDYLSCHTLFDYISYAELGGMIILKNFLYACERNDDFHGYSW